MEREQFRSMGDTLPKIGRKVSKYALKHLKVKMEWRQNMQNTKI